MKWSKASLSILALAFPLFTMGESMASENPGTLKALFVYQNEIATSPGAIRNLCPAGAPKSLAAIATDVVVNLVGKVTESLIDAAAMRTQAEATTLDVTVPIEGYFNEKGEVAVDGGCLIFHNAEKADLSDASLTMSLVLKPSYDKSAFRFSVFKWDFQRFLKPETSRFAQKGGVRDFVIKIEFLTPGSSGLGTRSVFVELPFVGISSTSLANAFAKGQDLPWFSAPVMPSGLPVNPLTGAENARYLPLNARITIIETTKPNQFALWFQDIAKSKKADVSAAVQDAVKKSLDPNYAATERAKQADAAATAYAAYKTAWDDTSTFKTSKPAAPAAGANQAALDKYNADLQAWTAGMTVRKQGVSVKRTLARSEFASAELDWPGDLPAL